MINRNADRVRVETELHRALARDELRLAFQPIVSMDTAALEGFEALVRWKHPEEGLLSPARFLPVAEESGLIGGITDWVLERACARLARWQQKLPKAKHLTMSVNLSVKQLNNAGLPAQVLGILARHKLSPASLKLEITETALLERGMNRVTDMCIPETVMRAIERPLAAAWKRAATEGSRHFPYEYLWQVLDTPGIEDEFVLPREESWVLACKETNTPIWTPGWEDSTLGNKFAAEVFRGHLPNHALVKPGTEQLEHLMRWYLANCGKDDGLPSVGFFQIGGGIAGDFPICAVPALIQDCFLEDTPYWAYFCQISDAVTSYGGYSGAVPNEKITWGKLEESTPKFMIQSDATIVAPLIFAWLLGE